MSSLAPKDLGAFILLLLVTVLPFSTAQNTYYVKPTPDTPCQGDPCHTLSEYVSESGQYFTSNTTIVFLPGEHVLQQNVTMSNLGRLALTGKSSSSPAFVSRIICTDATLTFTNIHTLEIADLDFYSCTIQLDTSSVVFKNSSFKNGTSKYGGAIYAHSSTIIFDGETSFEGNQAVFGGGLFAEESHLTVHENTTFSNNKAIQQGGGIYIIQCHLSVNSSFINNTAKYGGGVHVRHSTVSFGGSEFIDNLAEYGGGLFVWNSTMSFGGDSRFIYNSAEQWGGAVYVQDSIVSFADSDFTGNSAGYFGGCMTARFSTIIIIGSSSRFMNNSARYGGCIFAGAGSNVTFSKATTIFSGNTAVSSDNWSTEGSGGAILAFKGNLTFGGSQVLTNNTAGYGGAICLMENSKIYLMPNATVYFKSNFAQYRGGALFVRDSRLTYCSINSDLQKRIVATDACFIQLNVHECFPVVESSQMEDLDHSIEVRFQDNGANVAGSVLYGGNLDLCAVCTSENGRYVTGEVAFYTWADVPRNLSSSSPYRVCICVDNRTDCSRSNITLETFPGMAFAVPVAALGRYDGIVPAVVNTDVSEGIAIGALQSTQQSNNTCTNLQFTVRSTRGINIWNETYLTLYADKPCFTKSVFVTFLPCPLGFTLSTEGSCECDQRLNKYEVYCDINDQSILRKDSVWIGIDEQSNNQSQGLILHPHCPFNYCKQETDSVNFTLNNTDLQCNYNRSGHLCGACQHGYSLVVGSSRCLPCSKKFFAMLIPFVFAGLALVIFLFICKVTVAAGTISGLIFYANVVRVNQSILFPSGESNILTVFIAWLNLDLGVETCFCEGMDAYSMMWLQFVFPIYIWLLVGLITILCTISTTAARILGSTNPIAVLATLFFLSYTKLLRTIIAAFSFTTLKYPDDEIKVVWLYDGNIGYLDKNDGRHIALFLASLLVFLFLFLPYTIFLLFGQCILPRLDLNKLRWLSYTNYFRMKSFLDAYYAPYKDRHRYWIGLLLVLRFVMFLISAIIDIESPQDPYVNMLVIIISASMLGLWAASCGVYEKWYLNVIETSFIFNLTILAAATYQVKVAGGNQAAVFYSSVSVAFSTFIGIIVYHVYQRLTDTRAWRKLVRKRNERRRTRGDGWPREDAAADENIGMRSQVAPTETYIDICTNKRREMHPITPPPSPTNFTTVSEPLDHLHSEDVDSDKEVEEMLPQITPPTVTSDKHREMYPLAPPSPPINFTDLREPLDLLTQ